MALEGTLIPVIIGGIRSLKDGSVSMTLETQELSSGKAGELFSLRNKIAYCYISARQVETSEMKMVDSLEPELKGKTPSQRLRAVMYLNWKQDNEGYPDSESYYRSKLENIIETYKSNLNP